MRIHSCQIMSTTQRLGLELSPLDPERPGNKPLGHRDSYHAIESEHNFDKLQCFCVITWLNTIC